MPVKIRRARKTTNLIKKKSSISLSLSFSPKTGRLCVETNDVEAADRAPGGAGRARDTSRRELPRVNFERGDVELVISGESTAHVAATASATRFFDDPRSSERRLRGKASCERERAGF